MFIKKFWWRFWTKLFSIWCLHIKWFILRVESLIWWTSSSDDLSWRSGRPNLQVKKSRVEHSYFRNYLIYTSKYFLSVSLEVWRSSSLDIRNYLVLKQKFCGNMRAKIRCPQYFLGGTCQETSQTSYLKLLYKY